MFSLHIKINFFIIASRYFIFRGALLIFGEPVTHKSKERAARLSAALSFLFFNSQACVLPSVKGMLDLFDL